MTALRQAMEERRLAAVAELLSGVRPSLVARRLKVDRVSVYRWLRDARQGRDLHARKAPGRPLALTAVERAQLVCIYRAGPRRAGCQRDRWTCGALAEVIRQRFGVSYHDDHAGKLLRELRAGESLRKAAGG
jgi:transposase